MSETERPFVISASEILGLDLIDTGRTAAVRLRGADGSEVVVLLPIQTAQVLRASLERAMRGEDLANFLPGGG